jgi:hypothetical protein
MYVCVCVSEDASVLLEKQEEGRQESHSRIVGDIENIKLNIDQVWQRVGECYTCLHACQTWGTLIFHPSNLHAWPLHSRL